MEQQSLNPDDIARLVLDAFARLPLKCKPRSASLDSGLKTREWVPLAGIVAEDGSTQPPQCECVALATGMKCVPDVNLETARGNVLHDSHAEVLVLRALNRLLLDQCRSILDDEIRSTSSTDTLVLVERQPISPGTTAPFRVRSTVTFIMYCSECPCGDASMELVMSRQADPTPWQPPTPVTGIIGDTVSLLGRGHFDQLGIVRRKPSRPDAPMTMSKSCTDKLALRQFTSILSSVSSLLIAPDNAYLHTLVLPQSELVPSAVQRAFGPSGRLAKAATWDPEGGYAFRPFKVNTTKLSFPFARPGTSQSEQGIKPSNIACVRYGSSSEIIINGVLQGRKQTDPRGASALSRRKMWELTRSIALQLTAPSIITALSHETYSEVKLDDSLQLRAAAKSKLIQETLYPWTRTAADRDWSLSDLTKSLDT